MKMQFQGTLRFQLLAFSAAAMLFVAAVGAVGWYSASSLRADGERMLQAGTGIRSHMQADMMHDALNSDVLAALLAGARKDGAARDGISTDLAEHAKTFSESIAELTQAPLRAEARAALDKVKPALTSYVSGAERVVKLAFEDIAAAEAARPQFQAAFKALEDEMEALGDLIEKESAAIQARSAEGVNTTRALLLGASVLAGACLLALGVWLSARISAPIAAAVHLAEAVAAGDLSQRVEVKGGGEAGQLLAALRRMGDSLSSLVGTVHRSADSIATGSSQIATGNADLSQRTERTAGHLQQTAAAMEELTTTVRQNADTAQAASQLAASAAGVAAQGGDVVGRVVKTMQAISDSSRRVADITGVIDSIAFQTNILALNAAVEAARAGEHGSGFAVVASEVRSLAQRSAQAAKEIKSLVGVSLQQVEEGGGLVGEAGRTMGEIVAQVKRVNQLIDEISRASSEQSRGIAQVGHAVTQLDQVTQQNAALVEESAAAAESLKQQAAQMTRVVAVFKLAANATA